MPSRRLGRALVALYCGAADVYDDRHGPGLSLDLVSEIVPAYAGSYVSSSDDRSSQSHYSTLKVQKAVLALAPVLAFAQRDYCGLGTRGLRVPFSPVSVLVPRGFFALIRREPVLGLYIKTTLEP